MLTSNVSYRTENFPQFGLLPTPKLRADMQLVFLLSLLYSSIDYNEVSTIKSALERVNNIKMAKYSKRWNPTLAQGNCMLYT